MSIFHQFLINNFILFCVSLVLIVLSVVRFRHHPRVSTYTILLMSNTLLIAIIGLLLEYSKENNSVFWATFFSMLGYDLRPLCLFFIVMMTGKISAKNKLFFIAYVPLIINAIIYVFAFVPNVQDYIFYFKPNDSGSISFGGGYFRFTSHIISLVYLSFLIYISFTKISSKHIGHGLTILSGSLFVVMAVIIETFLDSDGKIQILNDTIAVCALIYYLYLHIERTQIDALTGLFNRETYYHDVQKMERSVTGVIQFDMNGLKYINDNFGHLEGDKALTTIAELISESAKKNMYSYRLGGDEYIILCHNGTEQDIVETVEHFKKALGETKYYCSTGYAIRSNADEPFENIIKEAEKKMYADKEEFYKNSPFERRNSETN